MTDVFSSESGASAPEIAGMTATPSELGLKVDAPIPQPDGVAPIAPRVTAEAQPSADYAVAAAANDAVPTNLRLDGTPVAQEDKITLDPLEAEEGVFEKGLPAGDEPVIQPATIETPISTSHDIVDHPAPTETHTEIGVPADKATQTAVEVGLNASELSPDVRASLNRALEKLGEADRLRKQADAHEEEAGRELRDTLQLARAEEKSSGESAEKPAQPHQETVADLVGRGGQRLAGEEELRQPIMDTPIAGQRAVVEPQAPAAVADIETAGSTPA